jgi:hypothetical protein
MQFTSPAMIAVFVGGFVDSTLLVKFIRDILQGRDALRFWKLV